MLTRNIIDVCINDVCNETIEQEKGEEMFDEIQPTSLYYLEKERKHSNAYRILKV